MLALSNLLALGVETVALGAYAIWGWNRFDSDGLSLLAALACAVAVALMWGVLAAPNSVNRLAPMLLLPFKITVFAGAALALAHTGYTSLALTFGVATTLHLLLALALGIL